MVLIYYNNINSRPLHDATVLWPDEPHDGDDEPHDAAGAVHVYAAVETVSGVSSSAAAVVPGVALKLVAIAAAPATRPAGQDGVCEGGGGRGQGEEGRRLG